MKGVPEDILHCIYHTHWLRTRAQRTFYTGVYLLLAITSVIVWIIVHLEVTHYCKANRVIVDHSSHPWPHVYQGGCWVCVSKVKGGCCWCSCCFPGVETSWREWEERVAASAEQWWDQYVADRQHGHSTSLALHHRDPWDHDPAICDIISGDALPWALPRHRWSLQTLQVNTNQRQSLPHIYISKSWRR